MKKFGTSVVLALVIIAAVCWLIPAMAKEYTLGIGDVLQISVWGHPDLTTEVAVRPDGYLTFPLAGDVWAIDKTPRQISAELLLSEFIVNPQVTVLVSQFRTLHVQVLGDVQQSGYYQLQAGSRLSDVLAMAGGPKETADLSSVTITRYAFDASGGERTEVLNVDMASFLVTGDISANPIIESGDMVFVPRSGRVAVFGEVRNPASYDLGSGLDIVDLLALAGGALETADLTQVVVSSQAQGESFEQVVNVEELLTGRGKPLTLKPNDVVFVPKQKHILLLGAVARPGVYALRGEQARLIDVIALAGGVLASGDASAIAITRRGNEQDIITVNIEPTLKGQPGGDDPMVQPDDLVFVPEAYRNAMVLGQVRSPGSFGVGEETRVLDLLARAGGATDRAGEKLSLVRDGVAKEIDLGALERLGLQNERVLPGDIIYVPEGGREVLVLGEVARPGAYQFRRGDRLLDIIASAGGLTNAALQEQVTLSRQTPTGVEVNSVDFRELIEQPYSVANLLLEGGDVIVVPRAERNVIVLGEVARPGVYQFQPGESVLDAVIRAGGFLQAADEQSVSLTRQKGDSPVVEVIDLSKLQERGFSAEEWLLSDGDLIVVPRSNRNALVLGEVRSPGYYSFSSGQTYLDLVARAGGFTADADVSNVIVALQQPEGVVTEVVNLDVFTGSDYARELKGGEIITVPKANNRVLVFGGVVRSGVYTLSPEARLLDILAQAGGLQTNLGTEQIVVTRQVSDGERVWQMTFGELMGDQSTYNIPLAGGDVIYVPAARSQVLVLGMVKNPGMYSLPAGARLMDAIALAGGPLERAALESVGIYRGGFLEDPEQVALGQDKVLFTGDASENPLLRPGDIIYVPETKKPDWTKIFGFIGTISTFKNNLYNIFFNW